jgi:hypothetical protein
MRRRTVERTLMITVNREENEKKTVCERIISIGVFILATHNGESIFRI